MKNKSIVRMAQKLASSNWMLSAKEHSVLVELLDSYIKNPKAISDLSLGEMNELALNQNNPISNNDVAITPQTGMTAIISVRGILSKSPSDIEQQILGLTDIDDIGYALDQAAADPEISLICLVLASPGGETCGIEELGRKINAIDNIKPVVCWTEELSCSAAYWLMSQGRFLGMTNSARAGNVGVFNYIVNTQKSMEKQGIEITAFSSGKYKLMGQEFHAATDDEKAVLDANVKKIGAQFINTILGKRPNANQEALESALAYDGQDSLANNLVDIVADSLDEFLNQVAAQPQITNMKVETKKVSSIVSAVAVSAPISEMAVAQVPNIESVPVAKADADTGDDSDDEMCVCDACKAVFKKMSAKESNASLAKAPSATVETPAAIIPSVTTETVATAPQVKTDVVIAPVAQSQETLSHVTGIIPADLSMSAWNLARGITAKNTVDEKTVNWRNACDDVKAVLNQ